MTSLLDTKIEQYIYAFKKMMNMRNKSWKEKIATQFEMKDLRN